MSRKRSLPKRGADLSARECQVLRRLAKNWTTERIATSLKLSPNTVKLHLQRSRVKLGMRNTSRAALTVWVVQNMEKLT
jgi:DNA-binding NarL/FixJ family response regulator